MWRGYENSLVMYGLAVCEEWISRGYQDTCHGKIKSLYNGKKKLLHPHWLGKKIFHASHKSNLIRKDANHYGKYFKNISGELPYIWPVA